MPVRGMAEGQKEGNKHMNKKKQTMEAAMRCCLILALAASLSSLNGFAQTPGPEHMRTEYQPRMRGVPSDAAIADIKVSFKLDSRLTQGLYMGERWVSPPTYVGASAQHTVEAKVYGLDAKGIARNITPQWIPADPEMVTVSPTEGSEVEITVNRTGESRLEVTTKEVSKELTIKAVNQGTGIQVEIAQLEARQVASSAAAAQDAPELKTEKEKRSYALGMTVGTNLQKQSVDVDLELYIQGLKDAHSGSQTLLTEEEARVTVSELQNELRSKQSGLQAEKAEKNKNDGEAFLAENKTREGVVTMESGLQYKVLKAGDGKKPTADDTVAVHYRGTLIDGTEFDSSYKRNQSATLAVNKVIKGWSEALQLMPAGSKWQLFIPSGLAYGVRGAGSNIGPNSTLLFEVELLSIKDTAGDNTQASASALSGIQVSYKMDPRVAKGLYMGDRWISPPTYTSTYSEDGKTITVEVRAVGLDATGKESAISPKWVPADPEMVTVTPSEGNEVKITVKRAGETSMQVTSEGVSKELAIKAEHKGEAMQVEIAQTQ